MLIVVQVSAHSSRAMIVMNEKLISPHLANVCSADGEKHRNQMNTIY